MADYRTQKYADLPFELQEEIELIKKQIPIIRSEGGDAKRELQVRDQLNNLHREIERLAKSIAHLSERLSPVLFHRDQTGEKESVPAPGLCDLAAEIRRYAAILAELGDLLDMILRSLEI